MKVRLGQTEDGVEVSLDIKKFFKQRLLVQGISGSWKSATVDDLMRLLKLNMTQETIKEIADDLKLEYDIGETDSIPQIILDWEGERIDMYKNFGNYIVLSNTEDESNNIDVENASIWGEEVRKNQSSVIIDLSSFKSIDERETIVSEFISAIIDADREYWKPCIILIDEGHNLCKQVGKCHSKDAIIRLCETGRKRGLATIMVTQRLAQLNKNASAQLANRIIGLTIELPDRESATKMLGLPVTSGGKELSELKGGEFYVFGDALINEPVKFRVDDKTPEELQGISTNPLDIIETLKEKSAQPEIISSLSSNQLTTLHVELEKVSHRLEDSKLVGYSEAMNVIKNRIKHNKELAGFWKKEDELQFKTQMIRGMLITDLVN